ncbi:MAG: hypothetical protein JWL88_473 [Parcubacteria group bacterium]|nr:hypothetical protein [Parcubacteria group bacterium]
MHIPLILTIIFLLFVCGVIVFLLRWRFPGLIPAAAGLVQDVRNALPSKPEAKPEKAPALPAPAKSGGGFPFRGAVAAIVGIILFFNAPHIWDWVNANFFHVKDPVPHHSSVTYMSQIIETTEPEVAGEILAPPNGSFDREDPAKAVGGTFSEVINLISPTGKLRNIVFTEDHALPTPNPYDIPWIAKCWPVGGGDPFIWNGSDAKRYDHCAFASKTDQPVRVKYWLVPS